MKKIIQYVKPEQLQWATEQVQGLEVIFFALQGSHMFGLNREGSDIDIKAVYIPSMEDMVLGKAKHTFNRKNEDLDIEIECKSLQSFLQSLEKCDTVCIDMLHTPEDCIYHSTGLWHDIVKYRHDLYAKNMRGLVGYIKTHSAKYSHKIDRYNEMQDLLKLIKEKFKPLYDIKCLVDHMKQHKLFENYKYVKPVKVTTDHEQDYLEVCGKKYICTWDLQELVHALEREIIRYGKRTTGGAIDGLDKKSLSHALRALEQLSEMIHTGDLKFPLKDASYIRDIKTGVNTNLPEILKRIDVLYDKCMDDIEKSQLQEEPNMSNIIQTVIEFYKNKIAVA